MLSDNVKKKKREMCMRVCKRYLCGGSFECIG
jgi:hypothetical protein